MFCCCCCSFYKKLFMPLVWRTLGRIRLRFSPRHLMCVRKRSTKVQWDRLEPQPVPLHMTCVGLFWPKYLTKKGITIDQQDAEGTLTAIVLRRTVAASTYSPVSASSDLLAEFVFNLRLSGRVWPTNRKIYFIPCQLNISVLQ